jgi:NitT/TauT family transport system ATP-binding protein
MTSAAASPAASIEGRGIVKSFGGFTAVDALTLDIRGGEFVSLLGPSGCGKSTLLRIIGGLQPADRGRVVIGDDTPDAARAAKQFGLVPQAPALVPWKTVDQNVRLLSKLHRRAATHPALSDPEVGALLETVGLAQFAKAYPHELSGGMQQRVSLVRAFALGAPILLMDEPFAALDETTRADMRYLLLDLWARSGTTVVFVTHSVTEAVILSDRVVVMAPRPGRIAHEHVVDLPRPRTPEMEDMAEFHEQVRQLRADLREGHRS